MENVNEGHEGQIKGCRVNYFEVECFFMSTQRDLGLHAEHFKSCLLMMGNQSWYDWLAPCKVCHLTFYGSLFGLNGLELNNKQTKKILSYPIVIEKMSNVIIFNSFDLYWPSPFFLKFLKSIQGSGMQKYWI